MVPKEVEPPVKPVKALGSIPAIKLGVSSVQDGGVLGGTTWFVYVVVAVVMPVATVPCAVIAI